MKIAVKLTIDNCCLNIVYRNIIYRQQDVPYMTWSVKVGYYGRFDILTVDSGWRCLECTVQTSIPHCYRDWFL